MLGINFKIQSNITKATILTSRNVGYIGFDPEGLWRLQPYIKSTVQNDTNLFWITLADHKGTISGWNIHGNTIERKTHPKFGSNDSIFINCITIAQLIRSSPRLWARCGAFLRVIKRMILWRSQTKQLHLLGLWPALAHVLWGFEQDYTHHQKTSKHIFALYRSEFIYPDITTIEEEWQNSLSFETHEWLVINEILASFRAGILPKSIFDSKIHTKLIEKPNNCPHRRIELLLAILWQSPHISCINAELLNHEIHTRIKNFSLFLSDYFTQSPPYITTHHKKGTALGQNYEMITKLCKKRAAWESFHFHLEPPETRQYAYQAHNMRHINLPIFESNRLSRLVRQVYQKSDLNLCVSQFIKDILHTHKVSNTAYVGKWVEAPQISQPITEPYFLTLFDAHSWVERKNPMACVRAYLRITSPRLPKLIVKMTPAPETHKGDPFNQRAQLRSIASKHDKIELIESRYSTEQTYLLIKGAQALISSHRAEGFGYVPLLALLFARPVLATNYGGVCDYLNHHTGYPISYRMRSTPQCFSWPLGAKWAEISEVDLARCIEEISLRPRHAQEKATYAQNTLSNFYSRKHFEERLENALTPFI